MRLKLALTAAIVFSQAIVLFAGETEVSSKNVIEPAPVPPVSYFRANEWDLGLFGTYDTSFNQNRRAIGDHAWGGGISGTYFPWLYAGFGIDGSLVDTIPGHDLGGQVDGKFTLRYPLDLIAPNLHLAPYAYAGVGGLFVHTSESNHHSNVLGNVGGGLEYRFTPHIGIFSDAGYEIVDGPKNNFMQVNFGLKFAF
jgi:Surface antigen